MYDAQRQQEQIRESTLVSERLDSIDERLDSIEEVARTSDGRLAQLVAIEERRDRREEALVKLQAEERVARGTWLRSLISPQVLLPIASAIGGALTVWMTSCGSGGAVAPVAETVLEVSEVEVDAGESLGIE